jgi:hypothetical protein
MAMPDLIKRLGALLAHARKAAPAGAIVPNDVLAELVEEARRLERENTHLRGIVATSTTCAYGHRLPDGICALGYPGCACEDDLVAMVEAFHDERGPWRKAGADLPVGIPHEERGVYESDDSGTLWYFRCTHWRPMPQREEAPPPVPAEDHPDNEDSPF